MIKNNKQASLTTVRYSLLLATYYLTITTSYVVRTTCRASTHQYVWCIFIRKMY